MNLSLPDRPADGFHTAAIAELDRYMQRARRDSPRYNMPTEEAERFVRNAEHSMRTRAFQEAIDPYLKRKAWYLSIYLVTPGFSLSPDGSLTMLEPEYPAEVRQAFATLDKMIQMAAEQHGLEWPAREVSDETS